MRTRESHACLDGKHRGRLFVSLSLSLSLSSLPPSGPRRGRRGPRGGLRAPRRRRTSRRGLVKAEREADDSSFLRFLKKVSFSLASVFSSGTKTLDDISLSLSLSLSPVELFLSPRVVLRFRLRQDSAAAERGHNRERGQRTRGKATQKREDNESNRSFFSRPIRQKIWLLLLPRPTNPPRSPARTRCFCTFTTSRTRLPAQSTPPSPG